MMIYKKSIINIYCIMCMILLFKYVTVVDILITVMEFIEHLNRL